MDDKEKEFWKERDRKNSKNMKYLLKKSYAIQSYLLPKVNHQLEVATKKSIRERLLKEKAELEADLSWTRERIGEITTK